MKKKIIYLVLGAISTVVLGAIGSGLWERVLSHGFDWLTEISINTMNYILTSYKDLIYADAANGFHEKPSTFVQTLIVSLIPLAYFALLLTHPIVKEKRKDSKIKEFMNSKNGYYALVILSLSVFITIMISNAKVTYTNEVTTYAIRSMAILDPYLKENEIKELRSKFHKINNSNDFYNYQAILLKASKSTGVKIPEFEAM